MSSDLEQLLSQDSLDMDAIGAVLDGMSAEARLAAVRKIHKAPQRRLYEAAAGRTGLSLDYMVPSERGELQEVIHEGHNSLPMFTLFQKRFARMPSSPNELCGYNEQGMRWATGPGYFVARLSDDGAEIAIDYTALPGEKPESWPQIIPQRARLGRFVYYDMIDMLRPISKHVTVGRAIKGGKETENYFLLCRQDNS